MRFPMQFFSDNAAAVHPAVWQAMHAADAPDAGYDGDALSRRMDEAFSALFGTECAALWVATGTAANWREVKQTKAPLSEMPPSSSTPGVKPAASVLMTPSRYQGSCVGEGESQRETVRLYSSLQGVELSIS